MRQHTQNSREICEDDKSVVSCPQHVQFTARLIWDRIVMEYTHDKYYDILFALVALIAELILRQGNGRFKNYPGRHHQDAIVFRRIERRLR
jgi:hypothetical protein